MNDSVFPPRDFFVAGGTLHFDAPSYVVRPADSELFHLVQNGNLCYVLTTRQMGKSSLMNRLSRKLQQADIATALIDLTTIGMADVDAWYLSLLDDLHLQLNLDCDLETWWETEAALSPVKRFTNFFRDVILAEITGQVVIFIDEVDSALNLDFSDDFFAAVRAIYNQTLTTEAAGRLSFVLSGVATPNELIKSQQRTPFNVGERVDLKELALADARTVFSPALPAQEPPIIEQVYVWTGGHPYLTQRLCQAIVRDTRPSWTPAEIDEKVSQLFFTERALVEESNLQFINGRVLASPQKENLLRLYRQIRQQKSIKNDERDPIQAELKLYGLVKVDENGQLVVRNQIYHRVFDTAWVKQHQAPSWKRVAWLGLVLVTVLSVGLSLILWRQAQQADVLLAETTISNFNETTNPTLRLDALARLIALDNYTEQAQALFTELPVSEQLALFTNSTPDLQPQTESVIKSVYVTQGVDTITAEAESSQVLAAMKTALSEFDRLENPTLISEIDSWLQARAAFIQNDYQAAQLAYSVALTLNEDNPATRFERVLVTLAMADYEATLTDLTILLSYGEMWQNRVRETISHQPQLQAIITAQDSPFTELAGFVPAATATIVPSITVLSETAPPTDTARATASISSEPTIEMTTAVFITTPLAGPHVPPTGSIVYTCFIDGVDQICSIAADGSNVNQHTFGSTTNWTASWTPGRETILFSSSRSGTFALYETDTEGDNVRLLLPPAEQGDYAPAVSPDGKQIAFTRAENGSQNIWIADRDGQNARPLTSIVGDAIGPTWSPDSRQIAYSQRLRGEDDYSLFIMNADGTERRKLPIPLNGIGGSSDWSPDGSWLAFYAGTANDHDIYLAAIDGSSYYRLTAEGDNLGPSFSPDGSWLVFTSTMDGDNDLYIMRLDGSDLTPLTINDSADWQPYWE